jgi:hypothetical protein
VTRPPPRRCPSCGALIADCVCGYSGAVPRVLAHAFIAAVFGLGGCAAALWVTS